ncbi:MAG: hypothetical protein AUJ92_14930 [Armatimonadetes bacterium CG2_30_59_28]|nr:response regulator [Armatimonadota bacterium]OIO92107.1 MAG: hypothetical protein AUJ92_14930 [Armatimonadetes bacterium CG2_30_59_28]
MPKKILCVEDEPRIARQIRTMLASDYTILEASDGRDAWVLVGEGNPDLVVADATLPRMNGWDLVRRIKSDRETRNVPSIILVERNSFSVRMLAKAMGISALVKKPINSGELRDAVRAALEGTSSPRYAR